MLKPIGTGIAQDYVVLRVNLERPPDPAQAYAKSERRRLRLIGISLSMTCLGRVVVEPYHSAPMCNIQSNELLRYSSSLAFK